MKNVVLVVIVLMCAFAKANTSTTFFQQYVSHQVKDGETVYSISKKYNVSEKQIFKLNPDAKDRIYEGLVLILPSSAQQADTSETSQEKYTFKKHKVRRKETLFSISQKYDVSIELIKKFNKELYSKPLRKGKKILIPLTEKKTTTTPVVTTGGGGVTQETAPSDGSPYDTYVVQPKETKYGIARMYGITINELETLNPTIKEGLKQGVSLKVPKKKEVPTAVIDTSSYAFYEVLKGDTMYSLLRNFDMKADELIALNPTLDQGLKEGMILKVPKGLGNAGAGITPTEITSQGMTRVQLIDSLTDFSTKRIAVMLPFGLKRLNTDTTDTAEDLLKDDRLLRIALDFHSGILMAAEAAKKLGISSDIVVYDTDYARADGSANARKVENIINSNDFSDVDVVIGPLLAANVNRASEVLSRKNIPLVSPLTPKINMRRNVFQSRPSDETLRSKMLAFMKANAEGKNIVIIADEKNSGAKNRLKTIFPQAKEVNPRKSEKGYYLYPDDISAKLSDTQENWVILESNDIPLISNATTNLNKQTATKKITLLTTNKGTAYKSDEIQHMDLMNLQFHFPSIDRESRNPVSKEFIDTYEDRYSMTPSEHAVRGYDIMFDTLMRLAYAQNLFDAAASEIETDQIENKFRYTKDVGSGYVNEAVYLVKYGEALQLQEILDKPVIVTED